MKFTWMENFHQVLKWFFSISLSTCETKESGSIHIREQHEYIHYRKIREKIGSKKYKNMMKIEKRLKNPVPLFFKCSPNPESLLLGCDEQKLALAGRELNDDWWRSHHCPTSMWKFLFQKSSRHIAELFLLCNLISVQHNPIFKFESCKTDYGNVWQKTMQKSPYGDLIIVTVTKITVTSFTVQLTTRYFPLVIKSSKSFFSHLNFY